MYSRPVFFICNLGYLTICSTTLGTYQRCSWFSAKESVQACAACRHVLPDISHFMACLLTATYCHWPLLSPSFLFEVFPGVPSPPFFLYEIRVCLSRLKLNNLIAFQITVQQLLHCSSWLPCFGKACSLLQKCTMLYNV